MPKAISAGRLDRKIQFERAGSGHDGLRPVETWAALGGPIWAGRSDLSDGERAAAGWLEAVTVARFLVRRSSFTAGVTPADRIAEGGRVWDILGIKESGRGWFELTAQARKVAP